MSSSVQPTDYWRPETKRPSLHSQKLNPNPKFLGTAKAYFCLPHRPNLSDFFDLCRHWLSVVRGYSYWLLALRHSSYQKKNESQRRSSLKPLSAPLNVFYYWRLYAGLIRLGQRDLHFSQWGQIFFSSWSQICVYCLFVRVVVGHWGLVCDHFEDNWTPLTFWTSRTQIREQMSGPEIS